MLSKNQIKFIQSLKQKKNRQEMGVFVVEGEKVVQEFLRSDLEVDKVYATSEWEGGAEIISKKELERISFLKTPNKVLALVKVPKRELELEGTVVLALDGVRDPGNLGTIIRLADWFGVKHILCSVDCVDAYNPKVVQSTMGSLARVQLHYVDLEQELAVHSSYKKHAAVMDGGNLFQAEKPAKSILIFGSESHGVSQSVLDLCDTKLTIPKSEKSGAESLNVANACAIALAQWAQ